MSVSSSVQMWSTAISKDSSNGRVIIFRFASELKPDFKKASQPDRIILEWRYRSETGQPFKEAHQRMIELEDALQSALGDELCATLALVSTGEGLREWTYYARSESEFMARLNYALMDKEKFPIEIHVAFDPEWSMYETFKAGVKPPPDGAEIMIPPGD